MMLINFPFLTKFAAADVLVALTEVSDPSTGNEVVLPIGDGTGRKQQGTTAR